ncbi:PfkB family carbohydrate kinase, partial [Candidatus Marinimicrobia bacterium]|nr:PfkB family carbohydrate kinase [Candidatus Neomarinimicrobiota bacterium]
EFSLGGAANVALNLKTLGANVSCFGKVGNDFEGSKILKLLIDNNIDVSKIVIDKDYQTTLKKRIFLDEKQLTRIDREEIIQSFDISKFGIDFTKFDACIISDYNKGVVHNIDYIDNGIVVIDPKKKCFNSYKNATVITPNINELQKTTSVELINDTKIIEVCKKIIKENSIKSILVKKGAEGMILVQNDLIQKISAHKVKNPNVIGAGDTVLSTLTLSYIKTKDIILSAKLANYAASISVSKKGTSCVEVEELNNFFI